jgi:hypothetical protein
MLVASSASGARGSDFGEVTTVSSEFIDSGDRSASISLGDVNGDGHLDVVLSTGRHWAAPIRLYLGGGRGDFRAMGETGTRGYASSGVPLADLNGDDKLDLVVENRHGRR